MNAPAELSAEVLAQRQREVVQALMAVLPTHVCSIATKTPSPTNATASPPIASCRSRSRCRRPRRRCSASLQICHRARRADRGARRGHGPVRRRDADSPRRGAVARAASTAIVEVDPYARTAACSRACATWRSREAAAPYGLYYAPDPSSQIACTIGGNVAENSGGVHCLKYGLTVHNVLRVRARDRSTATSSSSAAMRSTRPGLDLLAVLIGSEGMLGGRHRSHRQADAEAAAGAACIMASFDDVVQGRRRGRRRSSPPASSRPAWR